MFLFEFRFQFFSSNMQPEDFDFSDFFHFFFLTKTNSFLRIHLNGSLPDFLRKKQYF